MWGLFWACTARGVTASLYSCYSRLLDKQTASKQHNLAAEAYRLYNARARALLLLVSYITLGPSLPLKLRAPVMCLVVSEGAF